MDLAMELSTLFVAQRDIAEVIYREKKPRRGDRFDELNLSVQVSELPQPHS
jgi:hypothetical protein